MHATLEEIENKIERATTLETGAAVDVLSTARQEIGALRDDPTVDQERRDALETRVQQRLRELEKRDGYDSGYGAAMNPDEDDAP